MQIQYTKEIWIGYYIELAEWVYYSWFSKPKYSFSIFYLIPLFISHYSASACDSTDTYWWHVYHEEIIIAPNSFEFKFSIDCLEMNPAWTGT